MKLCVDCARHKSSYYSCDSRCFVDAEVNPVDGTLTMYNASAMRRKNGRCGPEAKLFVQKKPWWKFWSKS